MSPKHPKDVLDYFFEKPRTYAESIKKMIESDESDLTRVQVRERLAKLLVKAEVFNTLEQDKIKVEKSRIAFMNETNVKKIIVENDYKSMLELQLKLVKFCDEKGLKFLPEADVTPLLVKKSRPNWIFLTFNSQRWAIEVGHNFVRCLHKLKRKEDTWAPHNRISSKVIIYRDPVK